MARARSDSPLLFEIVEKPDFSFETKAMADGLWPCAGMDEAGRGPLAGPVVAAAVVLDPANIPEGLDDSKRLTHLQREIDDRHQHRDAADQAGEIDGEFQRHGECSSIRTDDGLYIAASLSS